MRQLLFYCLLFGASQGFAQNSFKWKKDYNNKLNIIMNDFVLKDQLSTIRFKDDQFAYHPKSGYLFFVSDFTPAEKNVEGTAEAVDRTYSDFWVKHNNLFGIYYQNSFLKINKNHQLGGYRYAIGNNHSFLLENYNKAQEKKVFPVKPLEKGKTFWLKNEENIFWLFRDGKFVHNKRHFGSNKDLVYYDTLFNQTGILENFYISTADNIQEPNFLEKGVYTFVKRSKGDQFWIYRKGESIGISVKYAYLNDKTELFVYYPQENEFYFSNFALQESEYEAMTKDPFNNKDLVWFKDKKKSFWLFEDGEFVTAEEYTKTDDGKSLEVTHPTTGEKYLLENYYDLPHNTIHPTKKITS